MRIKPVIDCLVFNHQQLILYLIQFLLLNLLLMIAKPKFKESFLSQIDNSILQVSPQQKHYDLLQNYNNCLFLNPNYFISLITDSNFFNKAPQNDIFIVDNIDKAKLMIEDLTLQQYIAVKIYNEHRVSYKGFISWLLLKSNRNTYLVDVMSTRSFIAQMLQKIFENYHIAKFTFNYKTLLSSLKRDFSIFPLNVFDLCALQFDHAVLAQSGEEQRTKFLLTYEKYPDLLTERPLKPRLQQLIEEQSLNIHQYIRRLNFNYKSAKKSYSQVQYYTGLQYYYEQINSHKQIFQDYIHKQNVSLSEEDVENFNTNKQNLFISLLRFREHVAKIHDVSVQLILPLEVIRKIVINFKISVLEISQLYQQFQFPSVGLQLCKRIYDIIRLHQQREEDNHKINAELFEKQLSKPNGNLNTSAQIKKLLKQINWGDSSEWINKRDDPSLKLYKEIISLNEFDFSIGEQYINEMDETILKRSEIGKYLKYAQYMRNKNYEKLQNAYNMSLIVKESKKIDEFSEEVDQKAQKTEKKPEFFKSLFADSDKDTQIEDIKIKSETKILHMKDTWDPNNDNERPKSSKTLLKYRTGKQIENQEQMREEKESENNSRSRKSSETSCSLQILETDQVINRSQIKALPKTLEQIYQLAQQVRKRFDKKSKKKEKKVKFDSKKEAQFIPTWKDIQDIFTYVSNQNWI